MNAVRRPAQVHAFTRLVNGAFKPPVVEALHERITAVTDQLLAALPMHDELDLMAGMAQALPVRLICDVLLQQAVLRGLLWAMRS